MATIEVPPLAVTVIDPTGMTTVGDAPWLTTRDDAASYVAFEGGGTEGESVLRLDFPAVKPGQPFRFAWRMYDLEGWGLILHLYLNYPDGIQMQVGQSGSGDVWINHTETAWDPDFPTERLTPEGPFSLWVTALDANTHPRLLTYFALVSDAPATTPPLRTINRFDALAGGAARTLGNSRANQSSNRTIGGHW